MPPRSTDLHVETIEMADLYWECTSGISGDMAVASLLDLGADRQVLEKALNSIPAQGFRTEISRVSKNGVDVCDFNVILDSENHDHDMEWLFGHQNGVSERHEEHEHGHEHHHDHEHDHHHGHGENQEEHQHSHDGHHHHHEHRGLKEVLEIIAGTEMTPKARSLAEKIFDIVAEAESKAHNRPKDQVHFHEVGALDSIVDVIAFAVCFDNLGIRRVYVPKIAEGQGTVRCQHGILPIPVPAVANIAASYGLNLEIIPDQGEFITPTGAAFVAACNPVDQLPESFKILKIGMGGGKRTYRRPSILRAMLIEEKRQNDEIYKLETNIDDCSGENLGFLLDLLMKNGALDVHYVPCFMKKNRPAWLVYVLCRKDQIVQMEKLIFAQTTTIGIRRQKMERTCLDREMVSVTFGDQTVSVKKVRLEDQVRFYPEYEDVAKICRLTGKGFSEIYCQILELARKGV